VLDAHGYVYVRDNGIWGDELYIHQSLPNFEAVMAELHVPKPHHATLLAWPWAEMNEDVNVCREELEVLERMYPDCWFARALSAPASSSGRGY